MVICALFEATEQISIFIKLGGHEKAYYHLDMKMTIMYALCNNTSCALICLISNDITNDVSLSLDIAYPRSN